MSWSKLRKHAREFICPALAKRLDFHITSYRRDAEDDASTQSLGRGWITLDGEEILSFTGSGAPSPDTETKPTDRQNLYEAIKAYPHLTVVDALESPSYIIRGLAMVDRRLGKRRLASISIADEHEFVNAMYQLRCEVER